MTVIIPGTTNECTNPTFEAGLTGWANWGSAARTQDTTTARSGEASQKVVTSSPNTGAAPTTQIATAPGEVWTISAYAIGAGTLRLLVREFNAASSQVAVQTVSGDKSITDAWGPRYAWTMTIGHADAQKFYPIFVSTTATTFWLDDVQIERGGTLTPFTPTSRPARYRTGLLHVGSLQIAPLRIEPLQITKG